MGIAIKNLHPLFCAEIGGVDTARPIDDATFAEIRAALDEYSVLVFHDQSLDDEKQIAFSRRFGALEMAGKANPGIGTPFARQSNLDIATGAVIPPEDRRMLYQKGNYLWHTDSSFRAVPSLCSLLSGRVVSCRRPAATPNSPRCEPATTRCRTILSKNSKASSPSTAWSIPGAR